MALPQLLHLSSALTGDHQSAAVVAQYAAAGVDLSSYLEAALEVKRLSCFVLKVGLCGYVGLAYASGCCRALPASQST